jgi:hypothetical protein
MWDLASRVAADPLLTRHQLRVSAPRPFPHALPLAARWVGEFLDIGSSLAMARGRRKTPATMAGINNRLMRTPYPVRGHAHPAQIEQGQPTAPNDRVFTPCPDADRGQTHSAVAARPPERRLLLSASATMSAATRRSFRFWVLD